MIEAGSTSGPGARWDGEGVSFTLCSARADAVEVCLFDEAGRETARHALPGRDGDAWYGYLPGSAPGQAYGYRVHGEYAPERGLRFNARKLLLDPYARALSGGFRWAPAVFDFDPESDPGEFRRSDLDSAPFVPKCVVTGAAPHRTVRRPAIPWPDMVIYEANVRGFTMRHPEVPESDRGRFRGMSNGAILAYLRALGITSLELMPVHAFIDEAFLVRRGLRNFWGYNAVSFFVPESRYAWDDAAAEFREMVDSIHDAGIEVILDVAYNHSGESDERGPTLCFRGIDNLAWYRTEPDNPGRYVNDTGCGNTLNVDHPHVRELVLASLRYWHADLGVDGFRFDLATVLGRSAAGFDSNHALLHSIGAEPALRDAKLIAEPWDIGPEGYQLGNFPAGWAEWNDQYRDSVRRFWRGDRDSAGDLATRLHGSADLFELAGREPQSSVNFITAHDGFTLQDLVSYDHRHNAGNGERNRDGHGLNYSCNHGVEGDTRDPAINALRRRQRLNQLATLLCSQGLPMLLGGDEFGNSQRGNNNAYCQDNEIGWLDWSGLRDDPDFTDRVRALLRLRREIPLLRQAGFLQGARRNSRDWPQIDWLHPSGRSMGPLDWADARAFAMALADEHSAVVLLFNSHAESVRFSLPVSLPKRWDILFRSSHRTGPGEIGRKLKLEDRSIMCLRSRPN